MDSFLSYMIYFYVLPWDSIFSSYTVQVKHYTGSVYVLPISADVDTEAGPEPRCYEAVTHG